MPVLSPEEALRRLSAILNTDDFGEAAHQVGGITKEALQEWARDNPQFIPPTVYETKLTASDRQRQHLARARGAPSIQREVPWADLRWHCLGLCDTTYDTYQQVIQHRRGAGAICKGADYTAVLPDEAPPGTGVHEIAGAPETLQSTHQVFLAQEDEEELLRAIVATLDERDRLRGEASDLRAEVNELRLRVSQRATVWSSVRDRLLGRQG